MRGRATRLIGPPRVDSLSGHSISIILSSLGPRDSLRSTVPVMVEMGAHKKALLFKHPQIPPDSHLQDIKTLGQPAVPSLTGGHSWISSVGYNINGTQYVQNAHAVYCSCAAQSTASWPKDTPKLGRKLCAALVEKSLEADCPWIPLVWRGLSTGLTLIQLGKMRKAMEKTS